MTRFAIVVVAVLLSVAIVAQEPKPDVGPTRDALIEAQQKQIQELLARAKQQDAQIAALARAAQREQSPAELERTYTELFQAAKSLAFTACKKVGGVLHINTQIRPTTNLSVTCELR